MIRNSITCDNCGKELIVDSSYPAKYSLELKVINTGINTSNNVFAVMMYPPFEGTKHFCDIDCLGQWTQKSK